MTSEQKAAVEELRQAIKDAEQMSGSEYAPFVNTLKTLLTFVEQAQRERDEAIECHDDIQRDYQYACNELMIKGEHSFPEAVDRIKKELDSLQARLLASEAAGAEMRRLLQSMLREDGHQLGCSIDESRVSTKNVCDCDAKQIQRALSTSCGGKALLDERERMRKAVQKTIERITHAWDLKDTSFIVTVAKEERDRLHEALKGDFQ